MLNFLDDGDDGDDIFSQYGVTRSNSTQRKTSATTPRASFPGIQNVEKGRSKTGAGIPSDSPKVIFTPASMASQSESKTYGSRSKAGDVIFRYNCKDSTAWETGDAIKSKWEVTYSGSWNNESDFKYMFQRTREMALTLNDIVSRIGDSIINHFSLDAPQSLKNSTAEDDVYLGRIRNEGKLTAGSIFFEGSVDDSKGHIVSLDFSSMDEYFVFPGQVLAISGKNKLGRCVSVSKMFLPPPLPFPDRSIGINRATGPLNIIIAAGPFTPSDSLQYEPLKDLISVIKREEPHVCILLGPFLEASHPLIETGEVVFEETFEDMFSKQMKDLSKSLESINTQMVIVSSSKDAHHHPVYPSPAYDSVKFKNFLAVPDPAMIAVGGVVIGITATDILMHLGRSELSHAAISSDRMGRMTRHLLSQRSFYPLYPADESVPLDIEKWTDFGSMDCTPHILVLPSELRHFIKDVDGTVVINPERLTKGPSGGTYARIKIDLPTEPGDEIGNGSPIADFVIGEILKI